MADDSDGGRSLALPLMLAGLAGSMLAIVASGGLALLGGAIAAACLAGSVVAFRRRHHVYPSAYRQRA